MVSKTGGSTFRASQSKAPSVLGSGAAVLPSLADASSSPDVVVLQANADGSSADAVPSVRMVESSQPVGANVSSSSVVPPVGANGDQDGGYSGKLNAKGAALSFVSPQIKKGKSVAILPVDEIAKGTQKWCNAAVLYVVGFSPSIAAMHRFIAEHWSSIAKPEIYWHDDGYFIINFCSFGDLNFVLCNGPHMYNGKPIIVKQWSEKFDFSVEVLHTIPLWVRLPNLPLNCWGTETLSRIGSLLGVPICSDECTARQLRVSFARLLVEIDVTKPLAKSVWVESLGGVLVELTVEYDWVPPFCGKCHKVGHICVEQQDKSYAQQLLKKPQPVVQPQQKKTWVPKATVNAGQNATKQTSGGD